MIIQDCGALGEEILFFKCIVTRIFYTLTKWLELVVVMPYEDVIIIYINTSVENRRNLGEKNKKNIFLRIEKSRGYSMSL